MSNEPVVFKTEHEHYLGLPDANLLLNPLTDVAEEYKEDKEMEEFYKLCNEYYSPEFARKYLKDLLKKIRNN